MRSKSEKIKEYISISIFTLGSVALITGAVCYNGFLIELKTNHVQKYCPICGLFGLEKQAERINEMEGYSATYLKDEYGERIDVYETESSGEEKAPVYIKTIRR